MGKITFGKMDTFEGVQECYMIHNGTNVGLIRRERPTRMGVHFRDVIDTSKPWMYTVDVLGDFIDIEDGTDLRDVKKRMVMVFQTTLS